MKRYFPPVFLSFGFVLIAVLIKINTSNLAEAVKLADYVGGVVGAIALIWLVFGYLQQNKSLDAQLIGLEQQQENLKLQKDELELYKDELRLQTEELRKIGSFSALGQIRLIADNLLNEIKVYYGGNDPLNPVFLANHDLEIICNSVEPKEVSESAQRWLIDYGLAEQVLSTLKMCSEMYFDVSGIEYERCSGTDGHFMELNKEKISKIPHLKGLYSKAYAVKDTVDRFEPAYHVAMLAWLTSGRMKTRNSLFVQGAENEHLKALEGREEAIPKIYHHYIKNNKDKN
ncbi:MAG: hypothetical protein JEY79_10475 [Pseudodesulfovibrio sp.]|nr:hypothetical protein [Pseudodesulfovibrio sp.]